MAATSASGALDASAAAKLRDEALAAAQKLEDEATSLRSTNTERSLALQAEANLLKNAAAALSPKSARRQAPWSNRPRPSGSAFAATPIATRTRRTMTTPAPPLKQPPSPIYTARLPQSRISRT